MVACGLEAILVGDIVERVSLAIGSDPSDGSGDDQDLIFGASILQDGFFCSRDTIAGFVAEEATHDN